MKKNIRKPLVGHISGLIYNHFLKPHRTFCESVFEDRSGAFCKAEDRSVTRPESIRTLGVIISRISPENRKQRPQANKQLTEIHSKKKKAAHRILNVRFPSVEDGWDRYALYVRASIGFPVRGRRRVASRGRVADRRQAPPTRAARGCLFAAAPRPTDSDARFRRRPIGPEPRAFRRHRVRTCMLASTIIAAFPVYPSIDLRLHRPTDRPARPARRRAGRPAGGARRP